ncbi:MAG: Uma2 family endonuclease [Acidobacteria bacterium]|nr:Uma2 family endonuclease [Acidobacteriota bacterium]
MQQTISETMPRNPLIFETEIKENFAEEPKIIKWTKEEYHYLAELGLFEGRRTEFLEGEIIEMPTMNSPHATALTLTDEILREVFSKGFVFRNEMPLDFGKDFEPVPDIAVVKGKARDFLGSHPQTADLIIEVSDTTLRYDRNRKASLYAVYGIQDYWILNLKRRTLEIYRRPTEDDNTFYGFGYAEKLTFSETGEISPLAKPEAKIRVADLLP